MANGKTLSARLVGMHYRIIIIVLIFQYEGGNMHNTFIDSSDVICIHGGVELDGKICDTGAYISYISHLEKGKVN